MTAVWPPPISRRLEVLLVLGVSLLALALRAVDHAHVPNGWRDDELSNALVVSQHVLDGEFRLYYADASGHEGLYHWLQAGSMALFGPGVWGIRGVSILLGTLTIPLTYLLARRLFGWPAAAVAGLMLAVSFWSLMYSRTGQRHISVLVTTLLGFFWLWKALPVREGDSATCARPPACFTLAGLGMGIGFYTYFASRGVPLILLSFGAYLAIWRRDLLRRSWKGLLLTLAVAGIMALPLLVTLQRQPEAEARVGELATPVYDALDGDFSTLASYTATTLAMFTHDGDDEILYNIPHRPVFGLMGGLLFWAGVVLAVIQAFGPRRDPRHAFLLLWLGAGLAPGALSVPAASLGHTLLAQPAAMFLPALALDRAGQWLSEHDNTRQFARAAAASAAVLLLAWEGVRGIGDYRFAWPADDFNRVLHHSDLHEAAAWLNRHPGSRNVVIGSFLHERWDQQALAVDLKGEGWQVRAFDPRSAYPALPGDAVYIIPAYLRGEWGAEELSRANPIYEAPYAIYRFDGEATAPEPARAAFANGLELVEFTIQEAGGAVEVFSTWRASQPLDLPPSSLLSKPPAPGEIDSPRLAIFFQLLGSNGERADGADGLGVDPYTLLAGDEFIQHFFIPLEGVPPGRYRLVTGLYDPVTGSRLADTLSGAEIVDLVEWAVP